MQNRTTAVKHESRTFYNSSFPKYSKDTLLITEDIKMSLNNLIISASSESKDTTEVWREEYFDGMQNEIFRAKVSDKMENQNSQKS